MIFVTRSPEETEEIGNCVGESLKASCFLTLDGDLGAGKTCLVRGLVKGLGSKATVTSPTFALVNKYIGGWIDVYHFDMFRVNGFCDLESTGFFDYLDSGAVLLVEWSANVKDFLLPADLSFFLEKEEENKRVLTVNGVVPSIRKALMRFENIGD